MGDESLPSKIFFRAPLSFRVLSIAAGRDHAILLDEEGNVWTSGQNPSGQLGLAKVPLHQSVIQFTKVTSLSSIVQVEAGQSFSIVLDSEGRVFSSGHNASGQLGRKDTPDRRNEFFQATTDVLFCEIRVGGNHCVAFSHEEEVYGWGWNADGQLASHGKNIALPTRLDEMSGAIDLAPARTHTLVLFADGTVKLFGWQCKQETLFKNPDEHVILSQRLSKPRIKSAHSLV